LLVHLDDVDDFDSRLYIVNSLIFFFEGISRGIGPVVEVLIPLVRHLLLSINVSK
jgi:hypothetical protein